MIDEGEPGRGRPAAGNIRLELRSFEGPHPPALRSAASPRLPQRRRTPACTLQKLSCRSTSPWLVRFRVAARSLYTCMHTDCELMHAVICCTCVRVQKKEHVLIPSCLPASRPRLARAHIKLFDREGGGERGVFGRCLTAVVWCQLRESRIREDPTVHEVHHVKRGACHGGIFAQHQRARDWHLIVNSAMGLSPIARANSMM